MRSYWTLERNFHLISALRFVSITRDIRFFMVKNRVRLAIPDLCRDIQLTMAIYLLRVNVFALCIFVFKMKQGPSESHIHPCETVIHTDAN